MASQGCESWCRKGAFTISVVRYGVDETRLGEAR